MQPSPFRGCRPPMGSQLAPRRRGRATAEGRNGGQEREQHVAGGLLEKSTARPPKRTKAGERERDLQRHANAC
jgi:hypothetical protein